MALGRRGRSGRGAPHTGRRTRVRATPTALVGAVIAVSAVTVSSCSALGTTKAAQETVVVTEVVATVTGTPPVTPPLVPARDGAWANLETVVGSVSGTVGIAVAPVGGGGEVRTAGPWQTGVAWSTIKVPLTVAVARTDPQALEGTTAAITVSDNQSAESLWNSLGGGDAAAAAVRGVLAEGGDATSQVPSVRTRDGFSVFGQTRWALSDQARFGSRLPCLGSSARVVDLMGQVSSDQRWGLGRIPGARFKGGWGPGESGGYLVRQFGLVPGAGGDVAVAIAIDAPSFEAGTTALSTMADALAPQLPSTPGGTC